MNGVDIADQYAVYSFVRKTVKWWRKVVFWLFETAIVNSYLLYTESTATPISHIAFRLWHQHTSRQLPHILWDAHENAHMLLRRDRKGCTSLTNAHSVSA